jgi:membrane-associated PAP2 superfamily phosphatase
MTRVGLIVAFVIVLIGGVAFGLYPGLDLAASQYFYEFVYRGKHFALRLYPPLMQARNFGLLTGTVLIIPAIGTLAVKLMLPRRKMPITNRAILFLMTTLALAPGLMANAVFKEHWSRPRPVDVGQFGGNEAFVAWWDPRGDCPSNCSFVSGDVSGAAWTFAPAALAPPQWRALAYGAAFALTAGMAAMRVMAGAHFVSDALFAAVFTFLIIWGMHGLIYRWPRTRLSDEMIETAFARAILTVRERFARLVSRAAETGVGTGIRATERTGEIGGGA